MHVQEFLHVLNNKSKNTSKDPILEIYQTAKSNLSKTWRDNMLDITSQPRLFLLFNIKIKTAVNSFKMDVLF